MTSAKGFTFIELIIVILILAVMAIAVAPRFTRSGFAEAAYQARLISALRYMQIRAMQDNRSGFCYLLNFNANGAKDPAFGPPSLNYSDGNQAQTCATYIDYNLATNLSLSSTNQTEMTAAGLVLQAADPTSSPITPNISALGFDAQGRPVQANGAASCKGRPCVFTITGDTKRYVCVASQGYIFASSHQLCSSAS